MSLSVRSAAGDSTGIGVGVAIGLGVGIGVGLGAGVGIGFGLGVAMGFGLGVAMGFGLGDAIGLGVGVAIGLDAALGRGLGVGSAIAGVDLGSGDAIGSRDGVGIASKIGVSLGCSVKVSIGSGVGLPFVLGVGTVGADSSVGDGLRWRKGVEAASCARNNGEAARKRVAIASKRMVCFRLSASDELVRSEASARSLTRSSRIHFPEIEPGERHRNGIDTPSGATAICESRPSFGQISWTKHAFCP